MGKGITQPPVPEYLLILVEKNPLGRPFHIVKKPDFMDITPVKKDLIGFLMPVFGNGQAEDIQKAFFEIFPFQVRVPDDVIHHNIHIEAVFLISPVRSPPVLLSFKSDRPSLLKFTDLIGARIGNNLPVIGLDKGLIQMTEIMGRQRPYSEL